MVFSFIFTDGFGRIEHHLLLMADRAIHFLFKCGHLVRRRLLPIKRLLFSVFTIVLLDVLNDRIVHVVVFLSRFLSHRDVKQRLLLTVITVYNRAVPWRLLLL